MICCLEYSFTNLPDGWSFLRQQSVAFYKTFWLKKSYDDTNCCSFSQSFFFHSFSFVSHCSLLNKDEFTTHRKRHFLLKRKVHFSLAKEAKYFFFPGNRFITNNDNDNNVQKVQTLLKVVWKQSSVLNVTLISTFSIDSNYHSEVVFLNYCHTFFLSNWSDCYISSSCINGAFS